VDGAPGNGARSESDGAGIFHRRRSVFLDQRKHSQDAADAGLGLHRNEYSSAVVNYTRNASPENEATLKAESAKNQQVVLRTHLWGAVFLFVLMNLGWFLVRRWSAKSSDTA
jgi:hypothetical protein